MERARVFVAYAREDQELRGELIRHLESLRLDGEVEIFFDGLIEIGTPWDTAIQHQIRTANVVVFLVTPDLIASAYVMQRELPVALQRKKDGEADFVPVCVRAVRLPALLADVQFAASPDGRPVADWPVPARDNAWRHVAEQIARCVKLVNASTSARAAGLVTLRLEQVKKLLATQLPMASRFSLCTRTGLGWRKDLGREMLGTPASTPLDPAESSHEKRARKGRFLFLDPEGKVFKMDSEIAWEPQQSGFVAVARTHQERKELATKWFEKLIAAGYQVRVSDVILPFVFWAVDDGRGEEKQTHAYIEVPVWKSRYGGNLYVEATGHDRHVDVYRQMFEDLWQNGRQWVLEKSP